MADYIATTRTNAFRVKDLDAFKKDLDRHGISHGSWTDRVMGLIIDEGASNQPPGAIELYSRNDHGTWPYIGQSPEEIMRTADTACVKFEGGTPGSNVDENNQEEPFCINCEHPKAEHDVDLDPQDYYVDSLSKLVSRHLVDGDVAIFIEVGSEKMRYLAGIAHAINSAGDTETIDLHDIYDKAARLGSSITPAYT